MVLAMHILSPHFRSTVRLRTSSFANRETCSLSSPSTSVFAIVAVSSLVYRRPHSLFGRRSHGVLTNLFLVFPLYLVATHYLGSSPPLSRRPTTSPSLLHLTKRWSGALIAGNLWSPRSGLERAVGGLLSDAEYPKIYPDAERSPT